MRSESQPCSHGGAATRVAVLHVRNRLTHATHSSEPLSVDDGDGANAPSHSKKQQRVSGIPIGRDACHLDPLVSVAHGTLECTPQHGVWVYVDHSERGTTLNGKTLVHRDAAIVRDGDVLSLGSTEITLAFQVQSLTASSRDDHNNNNNNNQLHAATTTTTTTTIRTPSPPPPPPPPSAIASSQLARQMLPNIQTAMRLQQPPPEYINSPIPGSNWRKKRHSISHVATRMPASLLNPGHASIFSSQTFSRSKPLVPSAPSTPPLKDAPAARHVNHHVALQSPQSAYYRVKFKDDPETVSTPESIPEDAIPAQMGNQTIDPVVALTPSPPLEYSSSPVPTTSAMAHIGRLQHSPSAKKIASAEPTASTKASPPVAPAKASPFVHQHTLDAPPARKSNRPLDLRIQVAKRNAGLASAAAAAAAKPLAAGTTTTPTANRPAGLSRGITIPIPAAPHSDPTAQHRRYQGGGGLDGLTPPASPVAHQDILRQNQSLLNILKSKYKEEQKLKREQEEWMRSQFPAVASSPSGAAKVPSMSPIRRDQNAGLEDSGGDEQGDGSDDADLLVPMKAPALLRTVSLGQTQPVAAQVYHQPSPRLTQAVLASRARKLLSPRADSLAKLAHHPARERSASGSSVASSVSTEPSNHRRVLRSVSYSSRAASSGELSDFLGYDDDDDAADGFVSFTSYYGPSGGGDEPFKRPPPPVATLRGTQQSPHHLGLRNRAPSLDDEMTGVLNSPSHASTSFGRNSAFTSHAEPPPSVAKPRVRSADVRKADKQRLRRMHQLGIGLERSPTHA